MWHHGGECSSAKATHVRLQPGGVVTLSFSVCEPVAIGVTRGDGGAQRPTGEFLDKVLAQIAGGREELSIPVDGVFQATSVPLDSAGSAGVMSMGRSSSLPLWNTDITPAEPAE